MRRAQKDIEVELNTKPMITKLEAIATLIQGLDVEEKKKLLNDLDIELNSPEFEPEKELVRSWEDACKGGFCIGTHPKVIAVETKDKEVFRTEKEAIAYGLVAAQLSQIVADANGDWVADWNDHHQNKWCVVYGYETKYMLSVGNYRSFREPFPMKSKEIAEACLEKHRTLWEQFWMV